MWGGCEYCGHESGHTPGCPNEESSESRHNCIICDENILIGDDFVKNHNGDYAHYDCVNYIKESFNVEQFFDITTGEMTEDE